MGAAVTLAAGAAEASATSTDVSTIIAILLALLGSSVLGAIVTMIIAGLRASATTRRDSYACAVQTLVSWCEYPYRIRRRTSDDPDTLTKLADLGHDLQERLARQRAWIAAESRVISEAYNAAIARVAQQVKAACQDAWTQPPIEQPAQMNLGSFGPSDVGPVVLALECEVSYRFGLRRLLPSRLLRRRLKARGCMP